MRIMSRCSQIQQHFPPAIFFLFIENSLPVINFGYNGKETLNLCTSVQSYKILSYPRAYRGIEWYKLRDPSFKIRDCETQNPTSEISRSGQNFPRPLFLEEPFYSPCICTTYFMKRQRVRTKLCSFTVVIHAVQNCHT